MPSSPDTRVAVDRVACSGHGVCAQLLPGVVSLDEWGYPVLADGRTAAADRRSARTAVGLCPARALRVVD